MNGCAKCVDKRREAGITSYHGKFVCLCPLTPPQERQIARAIKERER